MTKVLVDTSVIIDFLRKRDFLFQELVEKQEAGELELLVSIATAFELFSGKETIFDKRLKFIENLLSFCTIVSLDYGLCRTAGFMLRDYPGTVDTVDCLIAATAFQLDAPIVTRNKKHFRLFTGIRFFELEDDNGVKV